MKNLDVEVIGITDYFSVENYYTFIEKFKTKYPNSKKVFFPNIEFRIDSRDGVPKIMEVNPRFWGSLQLSILSGVDFPYLLYKALLPLLNSNQLQNKVFHYLLII